MTQIEIDSIVLAILKSQLKIEEARLLSFSTLSDNSNIDIKYATQEVIREVQSQIKKLQTN